MPVYNFQKSVRFLFLWEIILILYREDKGIKVTPKPILLIEGIFGLYDPVKQTTQFYLTLS